MFYSVFNATQNKSVVSRVRAATSLKDRTIGLLRTPSLTTDEGLWLKPCRSIHTWFMRYPIDVLFLSPAGDVLHATTIRPWRFSRWVAGAEGVLELQAGTGVRTGVVVGDRLRFEEVR